MRWTSTHRPGGWPPRGVAVVIGQGGSALGGRRVDHRPHPRDAVAGEATQAGVLADDRLVPCVVDAEDGVAGHVTVDPLHVGSEATQDVDGLLGNALQIFGGQVPGPGEGALDNELRHGWSPVSGDPGWRHRVEGTV